MKARRDAPLAARQRPHRLNSTLPTRTAGSIVPSPPAALAFFSQAAGPGFRRTTTAQQLYVPPEVFVWLRALGMDELPECLTPTEKRKIMHQLSSFAAQRRAPEAPRTRQRRKPRMPLQC